MTGSFDAPDRAPFDPRIESWEGAPLDPGHPLYVERSADRKVAELARLPGRTVLVQGPFLSGKSGVLTGYCEACLHAQKRVARIDFAHLSFVDYPALLTSLASAAAVALGAAAPDRPVKASHKMTAFVQRTLLGSGDDLITLAFDDAERVVGQEYQDDFFAMLRSWHNNRASSPPWANVDLALVVSTPREWLITDPGMSNFNVIEPTTVGAFTLEECQRLNELYPTRLPLYQVSRLFDLLGGHPFLTRIAHRRLVFEGTSLDDLIRAAPDPEGPFRDFWRTVRIRLRGEARFRKALATVAKAGEIADDEIARFLGKEGFIRFEAGHYCPANLLYERVFKTW